MGALGFAAMAAYVQFSPRHSQTVAQVSTPYTGDVPTPPVALQAKGSSSDDAPPAATKFLLPQVSGDDVALAASSQGPAAGEEPAVFLANASLRAVHADGPKALSVKIKDRIALLDFSPEIEDGFGSSQEASFIKALQVSLGQLPGVDKFQILVNGQPIESLGHFEVTDPIEVTRSAVPATP